MGPESITETIQICTNLPNSKKRDIYENILNMEKDKNIYKIYAVFLITFFSS
jgi:hypothetical protein